MNATYDNPYDDPGFSVWVHALPPPGAVALGEMGRSMLLLGAYARSDPDFPYPATAFKVSDYLAKGDASGVVETLVAITSLFYIAARSCGGDA